MSDEAEIKNASEALASWALWILSGAVLVYLMVFSLYMLFPGARSAAKAIGLSRELFEIIYYPIFRFLTNDG